MTFFLVNKNILKNIKSVFNYCGLNMDRIILKPFVEGINLLSQKHTDKNFTILKLEENRINISLFKNKSFVFTEDFNFGFNFIIKDISKLCSLKTEEVENFMKEVKIKNSIENNKEEYLENKYFYASPYRKIKYQLVLDIMIARLEELFEISYKKNTNIKNLRINDKIYVYINSFEYYKNIQFALEKSNITTLECVFNNSTEPNMLAGITGACELVGKGWEKEAIPINHKKKSLISGFFSKLFS